MKVLCFGSLNIDYTYQVDHFVKKGETLSSDGLAVYTGGKGLNQSLALARAGADVTLAGAIGKDGLFLLDTLKEGGVDTSCVKVLEEERTGNAIIQNDREGDNCILLYGGANQKITREMADEVLGRFSAGDFLLLQNEINGLDHIIRRAAQKGLRILFNPAPMEAGVKDLPLELLDTLIVNEGEGRALAGDMDALRAAYPNQKILLTQGSRGASLWTGSELIFQPAFPVKAVDTTAAGDCFLGYYAAALAEDLSFAQALRLASAASALAVQKQGAAPSIPLRAEVEAFLREK